IRSRAVCESAFSDAALNRDNVLYRAGSDRSVQDPSPAKAARSDSRLNHSKLIATSRARSRYLESQVQNSLEIGKGLWHYGSVECRPGTSSSRTDCTSAGYLSASGRGGPR